MASVPQTGIVQSFERVVIDGVPLVEVQVDAGGGELLTLDHVDSCGEDSPPLAGDHAAVSESTGAGAARSAGYLDPKNPGAALAGEKRMYARDADGAVAAEVWIKGNGDVAIRSIKSGGKIILNGVEIDQDGNVTVPGKVDATGEVTTSAAGAPVTLSQHTHPTGVGPSGPAIPGG